MNKVMFAALVFLSSSLANANQRPCAQAEDALASERLRLAHIRQCNFTAREMREENVDRKSVICAGDPAVSRLSEAAHAASPGCFDRTIIQELDWLKDGYDSNCWQIHNNDRDIHSRVCVGNWDWLIPVVDRERRLVQDEYAQRMRTPAGIIEGEQERLRYLRECSPNGRAADGICARPWTGLRDSERGFPARTLSDSDRVTLRALKMEYDSLCEAYKQGVGADTKIWQSVISDGLCNADWLFLGPATTARANRVSPGPLILPGVQDILPP